MSGAIPLLSQVRIQLTVQVPKITMLLTEPSINYSLEKMRKEADHAQIEVTGRCSAEVDSNTMKSSGYQVSELRFEPGTYSIQRRGTNIANLTTRNNRLMGLCK
jgi:hypothetical protein